MFRVYKPKNFIKVRALQVTQQNVQDVAALLLGRVSEWDDNHPGDGSGSLIVKGVEVPTFEGAKRFEIGSWIIRAEDNTLSKMTAKEFEDTYEVARNTDKTAG